MKYTITIGKNQYKRKQYEQKSFETFKELVQFLREGRQYTLANNYHKSNSQWISSEVCKKNTAFKQDNFEQNGSISILDFDGELKLNDCKTILEDNNFSYYIYNSTNNGNKGKEKFRLVLPLDQALRSKEEVRAFYKAINKLFKEKADSSKLTSCSLMYKPQNWKSTIKGVNPNATVNPIDEYYFDGINVDTDDIIKKFPEERIEYQEWDSDALAKIDSDRQSLFAQQAKEEFLSIPTDLGIRHSGLWDLSLKLKSYGLSSIEIQTILESVNYEKSNQNISEILKGIKEKDIAINPSVFKIEFYKKEIIDKKLKKFKTSDNPIIITRDTKVSELTEFQISDIFTEGVNLFSSPTNSGKTYYVLNEYINYIDKDDFVVLLVPYLTLLQEIKTNPNVYAISGDDKFDIEMALKKRVIVSTYDKIKTLEYAQQSEFSFEKCHFFIDEAHNLYSSHSYRHKILNTIFNLLVTNSVYKKLILMSGTFDTSYFGDDFIDNYVNVRRDIGNDTW